MENPDHRKAWEILKEIPEGQKNLFLVRAILNEHDTEYLEEVMRKTVREELESFGMKGSGMFESAKQEGTIAPGVGFYLHAAGRIAGNRIVKGGMPTERVTFYRYVLCLVSVSHICWVL